MVTKPTVDFRLPPCDTLGSENGQRLLWGTALTWALSIPCIIDIFTIFTTSRRAAASEQKTTVLVAIALGAEVYTIFVLILGFLLARGRNCLADQVLLFWPSDACSIFVSYIGWNVVMLMGLAGVFVWLRHIP